MDVNQYKLLQEILLRLDRHKVLRDLVLVGGWCAYFYREYYFKHSYVSPFRTPDLDFLVPFPHKLTAQVDIPKIFEDLGFIEDFRGRQGYVQLSHPDLRVEFLVNEKGRGEVGPVLLKKWNMNAQPLRFMEILLLETISLEVDGIKFKLPHPACFSFQKLIISLRRSGRTAHKAENDRKVAIEVLKELLKKEDEGCLVRNIFLKLGKRQQNQVVKILKDSSEEDVVDFLNT